MTICTSRDTVLFKTYFDEKYDLIQKFSGIDACGSLRENSCVDFLESGLMQRNKWDYWHIDVPFALNTDEASPVIFKDCHDANKRYILGGNHGWADGIAVCAQNHGKTVADVGSLWRDDTGAEFTLMRVMDSTHLLFLSNNLGDSENDWSFVKKITGKLTYLENGTNTSTILFSSQLRYDIMRVLRHKEKQVYGIKDGIERVVLGEYECEVGEIREIYEIINPATMAKGLREGRLQGGYITEPDLALFGEPMLSCALTYRIENDGTVLIYFDYQVLGKINPSRFMGLMSQEKLDVYGGGIWRYFPKVLPFETAEGAFDFSVPTQTVNAPFPHKKALTRALWQDKASPCERMLDYFRDEKGNDRLGFACGFLPVYDGRPEIRCECVSSVVDFNVTRKYYPTFAEGELRTFKGVGYKKYFQPVRNKASYYLIPFDGKKYIYVDIFTKSELKIPVQTEPRLLEHGGDISYHYKEETLYVYGEKGFFVFVV